MCTVHAETLEPYGLSYTYEVATYTNNIPPEISAVLSNSLFVDDDCIGGVMLKQKGNGQARKLIDVSEETAVSVLLGCTFCGYSTNYDGSLVDTRYARVTEDKYSSICRKALA